MDGYGAGFGEGGLFVGDAVGDGDGFPFVQQDVFGVGAEFGVLGESHRAVVKARVAARAGGRSSGGRIAAAADYAVADSPLGYALANLGNDAAVFVSHYSAGRRDVVHKGVDVGAAYGAVADADDDFAGAGLGRGDFLDLQAALALIDCRFHRGASFRARSARVGFAARWRRGGKCTGLAGGCQQEGGDGGRGSCFFGKGRQNFWVMRAGWGLADGGVCKRNGASL